jgi:hypothetical protein
MRAMNENPQTATYIVRLMRDPAGEVSGVVERVRTGVKHPFEGRVALCEVLQDLIENTQENGGQA